ARRSWGTAASCSSARRPPRVARSSCGGAPRPTTTCSPRTSPRTRCAAINDRLGPEAAGGAEYREGVRGHPRIGTAGTRAAPDQRERPTGLPDADAVDEAGVDRQGSRAALASTTTPQISRAVRTLVAAASAPPRAMPIGWLVRDVIDQQEITRDRWWSSVSAIR